MTDRPISEAGSAYDTFSNLAFSPDSTEEQDQDRAERIAIQRGLSKELKEIAQNSLTSGPPGTD